MIRPRQPRWQPTRTTHVASLEQAEEGECGSVITAPTCHSYLQALRVAPSIKSRRPRAIVARKDDMCLRRVSKCFSGIVGRWGEKKRRVAWDACLLIRYPTVGIRRDVPHLNLGESLDSKMKCIRLEEWYE